MLRQDISERSWYSSANILFQIVNQFFSILIYITYTMNFQPIYIHTNKLNVFAETVSNKSISFIEIMQAKNLLKSIWTMKSKEIHWHYIHMHSIHISKNSIVNILYLWVLTRLSACTRRFILCRMYHFAIYTLHLYASLYNGIDKHLKSTKKMHVNCIRIIYYTVSSCP